MAKTSKKERRAIKALQAEQRKAEKIAQQQAREAEERRKREQQEIQAVMARIARRKAEKLEMKELARRPKTKKTKAERRRKKSELISERERDKQIIAEQRAEIERKNKELLAAARENKRLREQLEHTRHQYREEWLKKARNLARETPVRENQEIYTMHNEPTDVYDQPIRAVLAEIRQFTDLSGEVLGISEMTNGTFESNGVTYLSFRYDLIDHYFRDLLDGLINDSHFTGSMNTNNHGIRSSMTYLLGLYSETRLGDYRFGYDGSPRVDMDMYIYDVLKMLNFS